MSACQAGSEDRNGHGVRLREIEVVGTASTFRRCAIHEVGYADNDHISLDPPAFDAQVELGETTADARLFRRA